MSAALKIARDTRTSRKPQTRPLVSHAWSHTGVYVCVITSALLNGYANSLHATIAIAGWMLGIMIPLLVLILSKVAGMQHRRRASLRVNKRVIMLAYVTAAVGACLLVLSVWHCACSLALLTGSHITMALPMAVAIDCGLVACELDIVLA
jgi:hypothetical protein